MSDIEQKIKCPKCSELISIDDALTHQIGEKIRKELESTQRAREKEMADQKRELDEQTTKLEEAKKNAQIEVNKKVAEKIAAEKILLWKQAREEADKQKVAEVKLLEEQLKQQGEKLSEANSEALLARVERQKLEEEKRSFDLEKSKIIEGERKQIEEDAFVRAIKQNEGTSLVLKKQVEEMQKENDAERKRYEDQILEKDSKLREATEKELEVRKEKNKLEEERRDFEIHKQRQLDEERGKIIEEAGKRATEEQQYVIAQLKKQLTDATKAKDELARKLEQGSQQTQGEVFELALEEMLKLEFSHDNIAPVPKGVTGADVIQEVFDQSGRSCGKIVWEFKKTKAWSDGWIQKLKDDQRTIKADVAVIVSSVLPENVKGFVFQNGVWICDIKLTIPLATALRMNLDAVYREKIMSVGKNEKMEVLYSYLTGVEFRQRVEAIVEAFSSMDEGLKKERMAFEKIWAEREKQIRKVITNTVGMYGDLSGLVTLPQIKTLELPTKSSDEG